MKPNPLTTQKSPRKIFINSKKFFYTNLNKIKIELRVMFFPEVKKYLKLNLLGYFP
jgi:hypothetical protein